MIERLESCPVRSSIGCNQGVDPEIVRGGETVLVRSEDGLEASVSADEWRRAVLVFDDEIQAFYDASAPKLPFEEDDHRTDGWAGF